ncbi:hypothetical protein QT971_29210 [Microcoleus sp. herbarium19]|uniref:hypothetical protein n=1 Tax=unclassified Microcoleus TaxID=2642155 RepID=UPI002FD38B22
MFHSLMQQFLAAESDSKPWLRKIGFIAFKPLLYKHSELLLPLALARSNGGAATPLSGQFTNWLFELILGVGDCGIASLRSVVNRNVF